MGVATLCSFLLLSFSQRFLHEHYLIQSYLLPNSRTLFHRHRYVLQKDVVLFYNFPFYLLLKAVEPHLNLYVEERSEEHTSELQSRFELVCRRLLEKKKRPYHIQEPCAEHTEEEDVR